MPEIKKEIKDIANSVTTQALLDRDLVSWRPILAQEINCFVFGENYICKRFDSINYKFCQKDEAKEIVIDNLYASLRFKYFPKTSEEIDERIDKIIKSFTVNLKTTLIKVSFDKDTDCKRISFLPDGCIAFRNGVYNFRNDCWLFKYDVVRIESLSNSLFLYDNTFVITWYYNFNFDPLPISIIDTSLEDFLELVKALDAEERNYCFELMYNISHDYNDKFSFKRFEHLTQIIGYTLLQSFTQYFVLLIGSGQNGKNSLFDSCLSRKIIPAPTTNSLKAIENDKFVTGSLENHSHNVYLETDAETMQQSTVLKLLTGSYYPQTIEPKGVNKYTSLLNIKYLFAGNDQEKIKFSDTTTGFRRRINVLEIFYTWDADKRFLKKGDYYDTTFRGDLMELVDDNRNAIFFIYFGMYGIKKATNNFSTGFEFGYNEWKEKYSNIDVELKEKISSLTFDEIYDFMIRNRMLEETKALLYDCRKERMYNGAAIKDFSVYNFEDMLKMFADLEQRQSYFSEYDFYINLRQLQKIIKDLQPSSTFTQNIKKIFNITKLESLHNNQPYVRCKVENDKLKVLGD